MNKVIINFILMVFCLQFVSAGYVGFNMSMDGDLKYNSMIDTPDQYNEVNIDAKQSHVDMSYWIDYENPTISIEQYPTYVTTQVTKRTANKRDILETIGEGFNFYIDSTEESNPSEIELWYNSTLKNFNMFILSQVYVMFFEPLNKELEFYKRKSYYMEKDLNGLRELMHQEKHDSYDCLALKSMMRDGIVLRGSCGNVTWIKDENFIVSFHSPQDK